MEYSNEGYLSKYAYSTCVFPLLRHSSSLLLECLKSSPLNKNKQKKQSLCFIVIFLRLIKSSVI